MTEKHALVSALWNEVLFTNLSAGMGHQKGMKFWVFGFLTEAQVFRWNVV